MDEQCIFSTALEKADPQARRAWLDEACAGDASLRQRVEALLRTHDDAGSFLNHPPLASEATRISDSSAAHEEDATSVDQDPLSFVGEFLTPCDTPDRIGKLVNYEIIGPIGRGGMGVVLRAFDPKLSRVVAIKVLAPELSANPTARKRFLREAQAAAAISHPHVVTIHAVEDDGKLPYLVMECIEGQSLAEKIEKVGTLGVKEILRIGSQIAGGLAAAHKQGLMHRDIKPANILLENGVERVKITDFGLARAVDDVGITKTGEVSGTPQYMSPEQALGEIVDHRSDLFGLGSVLYTMCTGRGPFRADSLIAVIRRVCDDTPRPIREVNPEITDWLVEIVNRLLAKKPADRFPTAQEVADLLNDHLAHLQYPSQTPGAARPLAVSPPAKSPDSMKSGDMRPFLVPKRRTALVVATLIMLALSVVFSEAAGVTNLAGTVIRFFSSEGTLVVEVDDPAVSVTIDNGELIVTGAGPKEIRLKPGQHTLVASKDGKALQQELITIARNGRQIVRVSREGGLQVVDSAFESEFQRVVQAGRGKLSDAERRQLLAENHPLMSQLADPNTKKLIELFANLPDAVHKQLLETGHLKWKLADLDPARRQVYEDAMQLNLDMAKKRGVEPPATMSLEALHQSEVGFAVVEIPALAAKVVSWMILLPEHPSPIWMTVVGAKSAGKTEYFAAHHAQLPPLRLKPVSGPPGQIVAGVQTRNPFGVPDVPDPDGADVQGFAATVNLKGDDADANAKPFMTEPVSTGASIEGEWASRWNYDVPPIAWATGTAVVKNVGNRVYIFYKDDQRYLIDAQRVGKDSLVGRYVNLEVPNSTSPWVGRIVNPERIDGQFRNGRWDFRRKVEIKESPGSAAELRAAAVDLTTWGKFVDPRVECALVREPQRITMKVPGEQPYDLLPIAGYNMDAPRLVREVEGDFTIQVALPPYSRPQAGTTSRLGGKYAYRSAGLLVWVNDMTLLRFERAGLGENNNGAPYLHAQWFVAGQYRGDERDALPDQPDGVTHLQVERKGAVLHLRRSADGITWTDWRTVGDLLLQPRTTIGLTASSSTRGEFTPVFEKLQVIEEPPRNAPPPAVAPFDASQAKVHQEAWAKHLGVDVEITNSLGMKLRLIPPGKFMMGSPNEEKERFDREFQHEVELTKAFYLGVYEVTQEEYEKVMGKNPSRFSADGEGKGDIAGIDTRRFPVEMVSWEDAKEFCRKLSAKEGMIYRLPSEAEWEYTCRAGTTTPFHTGETIATDQANYNGSYVYDKGDKGVNRGRPTPVGSFAANAMGLHDMHANVAEWCEDLYNGKNYSNSPKRDPLSTTGNYPVMRGGAWGNNPGICRSAYRTWSTPGERYGNVGFRVVIVGDLKPKAPQLAIAPFDAEKAKEHQQAWAKHLGVEPEITNSLGMKLRLIPPGEFTMGATDAEIAEFEPVFAAPAVKYVRSAGPAHKVRITKPTALGVDEVTVGQFAAFVKETGHVTLAEKEGAAAAPNELGIGTFQKGKSWKEPGWTQTDDFPVVAVSWHDAVAFCEWLSKKEGRQYRLPTEAEWEHACRAGTTTPSAFGPVVNSENAVFGRGVAGHPEPVGGRSGNAFGLRDMHGNVHEWCLDSYQEKYYHVSPLADPPGPNPCPERVLRGQAFDSPAQRCLSCYRFGRSPEYRAITMGFRVTLVDVAPAK